MNALTELGHVNMSEVLQTLQQAGGAGTEMSRPALYRWLELTLGEFQICTFCESCMELMLIQSPLDQNRHEWSDELFSTYDFDGGGTIDLEELTALMQNHDAEVQSEDVLGTICAVGAKDELDLFDFHLWVALVFGSLSDTQFEESMNSLLSSAPPPKPTEHKLRPGWAAKVFAAYDTSQSGTISKDEFTTILRQLVPTASMKDVESTMARAGATEVLKLEHLIAWALHVFDNVSDENYIQNMTLLLDAAPKVVHSAGPSLTAAEPTIRSQDSDIDINTE